MRARPMKLGLLGMVAALALVGAAPAQEQPPLTSDLQVSLEDWRSTDHPATAITDLYLGRIQADEALPWTNAVLALNPDARAQAERLDAVRPAEPGLLYGLPILIKDNIETADPMPTTAGSLALALNITGRDAPLVARLRAAGMVILGKANLSEWANIRDSDSTSGWSAVGGQTVNPHRAGYSPCGSSSGSGAAVAAGLAPAAIGTETDGSITCPAAINGIVGFKPTVGLVSRTHIVPISASQDTAGPMTLTVRDAAAIMTVIAGSDPLDPATAEADRYRTDYVAQLSPDGLRGLRIGALTLPGTDEAAFAAALERLRAAGAVVVPITPDLAPLQSAGSDEIIVLLSELRSGMAAYLSALPDNDVTVRTVADLVAFNQRHAALEMGFFGQDLFELTEGEFAAIPAEAVREARERSLRVAGAEGIDAWLAQDRLDLIVAQTNSPTWAITLGQGDAFAPPSASRAPAIAGYPHLTVPMGTATGTDLPIGLSFIGPRWSDALVLRAGHAFEVAGPSLRRAPTRPQQPNP